MTQTETAVPTRFALVGAAAGLLGGFFGVGGGIILVPLLVWLGLGRHRAHATSLASFIVIATAGAISFGVAGAIDVRFGLAIGLGGVVGSIVGATLMSRLSSRTLAIVFAMVLLVAGLRMVFGGDPLPGTTDLQLTSQLGVAVGVGMVSGLFAGLVGIGGGVVIVPAAVLLLGLDQHVAQGTSLLAIVLTAVAGSVVNLRNRLVRPRDALFIGAGGVVGSVIGTRLALGLDGDTLGVVFGFWVLIEASRTFYRIWREREAA